jgi:hypothetical protein
MKRKRQSTRSVKAYDKAWAGLAEMDKNLKMPRGLEDVRRWVGPLYSVNRNNLANFIEALLRHPETLKKSTARTWGGIDLDRARETQEKGGRNRGVGLWERRRTVLAEFNRLRADPRWRRFGETQLCKMLAERFRAAEERDECGPEFRVGWLTVYLDLRAARRRFPA